MKIVPQALALVSPLLALAALCSEPLVPSDHIAADALIEYLANAPSPEVNRLAALMDNEDYQVRMDAVTEAAGLPDSDIPGMLKVVLNEDTPIEAKSMMIKAARRAFERLLPGDYRWLSLMTMPLFSHYEYYDEYYENCYEDGEREVEACIVVTEVFDPTSGLQDNDKIVEVNGSPVGEFLNNRGHLTVYDPDGYRTVYFGGWVGGQKYDVKITRVTTTTNEDGKVVDEGVETVELTLNPVLASDDDPSATAETCRRDASKIADVAFQELVNMIVEHMPENAP